MTRKFIVRMDDGPRTWLRLPDSFAGETEELAPVGLWLQPDDCCNGPTSVAVEFHSLGFMFLGHGCKSFALDQGLQEGNVIHFKFYGATTRFVRAFRSTGDCLDCCMEGDNGGGTSSSLGTDGISNPSSEGSGATVTPMAPWVPTSRKRRGSLRLSVHDANVEVPSGGVSRSRSSFSLVVFPFM
ncbi:hypothetical protein D1007_44260 [Hordeum vulgare]|nr:hypothetical protein D1007_44260 [Hordeum vulgare]